MNMLREPIQKRSIEKKERILKAGFYLFTEKGYHNTNTVDIAKRASVSTGAVYNYYSDKRDIFIESYEDFLNEKSMKLFEKLENIERPFELSYFIDKWITYYFEFYSASSNALTQLRAMMFEDEIIKDKFCDFDNNYFSKIVNILENNGLELENILEKVYLSCILIDGLQIEKYAFPHNSLKFDVLKKQVQTEINNILS